MMILVGILCFLLGGFVCAMLTALVRVGAEADRELEMMSRDLMKGDNSDNH